MEPRKKVVDFHIPKLLGIKAIRWKRMKSEGIAPKPAGIRVNPNGAREPYWYADSLLEWFGRNSGRG